VILMLKLVAATLSSGYGLMFALTAKLRDAYGLSSSMIGWIVGVGFFTSFAAQILVAPMADRGHARTLLVGGIGANVAGIAMMGASSGAFGLLSGRALMGLGIGSAYPAIRRAIALADPENVGKNQGGLLSYDVAGFLCGPAIAAMLVGPLGLRWPFYGIAAVIALSIPFVARLHLDERNADGSEADAVVRGPSTVPTFALGLLKFRWMQSACCYGIAFFIMIGVFDSLWALRIKDMHASYRYTTIGIIVFALPMVFLGERGGTFIERKGPFMTGAAGLLVGTVFVTLYGSIAVPQVLILVGVFHAINDSFTASSAAVGVTLTAPTDQLAGAQGLLGGFQTLTGGIAAVAAAAAYDAFGPVRAYGSASIIMLGFVALGWSRAGEFRSIRKVESRNSEKLATDFPPFPAQVVQ
jgi:MFS family permease